jgi:hypothetical protein
MADPTMAPVGISTTVIAKAAETVTKDTSKKIDPKATEAQLNTVAGKDKVINQTEVKKTQDQFKTADAKVISPDATTTKAIWTKAAENQNLIIPGNDGNTTGGTNFKIGGKDVKLGGSAELKIDNEKVSIDTISTPEQQATLNKEVQTATTSADLQKITKPKDETDKTTRQEKIKELKAGTDTTNVTLLDDNKNTLANLDKNRAELNKRREEVRLATKNGDLTEEQKTTLKAEQKALDESLKTIDAVPKVFATQNGAKLEIKNGSNIRSINKDQINSENKLNGYEGMFEGKDTENQTEVKIPTVKQAYESFAKQMKESTGKDFTLGDNQNLVMYRDGDSVKFLIVDSRTGNDGNRETIVTKPVIATRNEYGETAIKTPSITKSGTSGQEAAVIEAKQFSYKAGDSAKVDEAGKDISINLVKGGQILSSFFDEKAIVKPTTTNIYPDFALEQAKITANSANPSKYNLELTPDALRLLRSTGKQNLLTNYTETSTGNYQITGLDKTDLDQMNKGLNEQSYLKAAITHLNQGGKLSDVLLSKPITKDELKNTQYAEDINNPRYKALITYITKSEKNDDKAITRELQENGEILPPQIDLINAGINTP